MGTLARVEIRRARTDERSDVALLYWQTWHETQAAREPPEVGASRPLAFFEKRVAGWSEPPLIVRRDRCLMGFAAWQGSYLGQLFVDHVYRSSGVGAHLLAAAEAAMGEDGCRTVWLNCIVGNDGARSFYERHGWRVDDEIDDPVTFEGSTITVRTWQMVKHLDAPCDRS